MTFHTVFGYLVIAASTTLGGFILLCALDVVAGAATAIRAGKFDAHKLPSWLGAQFATKEFLGVIALGTAAAVTALGSTLTQGPLTQEALQAVAQIALAAMTAGAATMMASVLKDLYSKVREFAGGPPAPPAPLPRPIPITVVDLPVAPVTQ